MRQHTSDVEPFKTVTDFLLQKITVLSQSKRLFFIVILTAFSFQGPILTISNEVHGPLYLSPRSFLLLIV